MRFRKHFRLHDPLIRYSILKCALLILYLIKQLINHSNFLVLNPTQRYPKAYLATFEALKMNCKLIKK